MRASIAAFAVAVAVAVAGCGGSSYSGGGSSTPSSTAAPAAPAATPAPAAGGKVQIALQNIAFSPSSTTAKVGQTVVWTNKDSVAHNVTATKGESFKSKTLNQGGTYSYKLDKPGTINYVCTFHSNMTATITVTK
jgi:plastocyanin